MVQFIDTHTHPYDSAYDADREAVLERAIEAGVTRWILPAIDSTYYERQKGCAEKHPDNAFMAIGLHPTSVSDNWRKELDFALGKLEESGKPGSGVKFYAIGEIGLDGYWSKEYIKQQMEVFAIQVDAALKANLPIIIHERAATDEMFSVLDKFRKNGNVEGSAPSRFSLRGVFHAFGGSIETYRRIKSYGDFKVGIGGVVTFKNAGVAKTVSEIPLSDILLETDAPWLTPAPHRGTRNESSYIQFVAAKVAEIKGCSVEEVASVTSSNVEALFGISG